LALELAGLNFEVKVLEDIVVTHRLLNRRATTARAAGASHKFARVNGRNQRPITDACRCAACGGLPFGTCLRSGAGSLRSPASSLRHVGNRITLVATATAWWPLSS